MSFTFSNEDDEDFGAISNSSSLASIFQNSSGIQDTSKSLVYTAPKQPLNKITEGSKPSLPKGVLALAAVSVYKLINEKYEPIPGKMGFALLGEHESKDFNLILYQNKQKPMASVKVSAEFTLTSQPDNFSTFYDNQRQNWAVLFDSKDASHNFFHEIEQVKMLLNPKKPVKETSSNDKMDGSTIASNFSVKENSDKTTLINRIAKLGQPILPLSGPIVADDSDAEQVMNSSPEPESQRTKPKTFPRPVIPKSPIPSKPEDNYMLNSMAVSSQMFNPMWNNQSTYPMLQYLPANFPGTAVPSSNNHFDTLLSEYRTQNSEIRMHLVRLTDKIDVLLQKSDSPSTKANGKSSEEFHNELLTQLHNLQLQSNSHSMKLDKVREDFISNAGQASNKLISPSGEAEMMAKERAMWMNSQKEANGTIQQLAEEITRLKALLNVANEKEQHSNLQQLKDENARLQTMITSASNKNDVSCQELREENTRLKAQLEINNDKTKNLILELEAKLETYQSKCAQAESSLNQLKCLVSEKDEKLFQFQQQVQMLETKSSQAHTLADALQMKLDGVKKEAASNNVPDTGIQVPVEEQVKTIMNKVYKETMKQFKPEESYSLKSIKSTLSAVIRDVTLAMLDGDASAKSAKVPLQPESSYVQTAAETFANTEPISLLRVNEENNDPQIILASEDSTKGNVVSGDIILNPDFKKERSVSFLETLHSSLAAAESHREPEQIWKPDPPPPPLFDDDDDEWLA